MSQHTSVSELFQALSEDVERNQKPFSSGIELAHKVMHHPFAFDHERADALALWLQHGKNQPCLFGRVAAAVGRMHYCVLTDDDVRKPNDHIRNKIRTERLLWKREALLPGSKPRHGFMVVVASPRVALAAPDANLKRFSLEIRALWDLPIEQDEAGNDLAFEWLYLKHPSEERYFKYVFTVDYFATAGDGRWWEDHRVPGGIAFTANSLGHMLRYRELYEKKNESHIEWGLKTAMRTINEACNDPTFGPATWLLELQNGKPHQESACPFADPDKLPEVLKGKDWSTYAGILHTDHSIRDEFFENRTRPSTDRQPWQMDFSYIYQKTRADHFKFVVGQEVSSEEIFAEIGKPDEWRRLTRKAQSRFRKTEYTAQIRSLLNDCQKWQLSQEELEELSQ